MFICCCFVVTIMVIVHPMWLKPAFRIIAGYQPAYSLSVLYLNAQISISACADMPPISV